MEGAAIVEDGLEKQAGDVAVEAHAAFDILVEPLLALDGDEGTGVAGGEAGGVDGEAAVFVAQCLAPFGARGEAADRLDDFVDDQLHVAEFPVGGDLIEGVFPGFIDEFGHCQEGASDFQLEYDDEDEGKLVDEVSADMPDDRHAGIVGDQGEDGENPHEGGEGIDSGGVA